MKSSTRLFYAAAIAASLSLSTVPAWAQGSSNKSDEHSAQGVKHDNTISTDKIEGADVIDQQNNKVGTLKTLFVDARTGRVRRADVDFSTGTGKTYSVNWNQLHLTEQNDGKVVAKVDSSVVRRVQEAKQEQRSK